MDEFRKNNINLFGNKAEKWFDNLPDIIKQLSQKWQLSDIKPVANMTWNYVAKANSKKYSSVCIKISIAENLILDEIKALKYFNGNGMVKLYDNDTNYHAILLHQAIPGYTLKNLYLSDKEQAINYYASIVKKLLHEPISKDTKHKHVSDWLKAFERTPNDKLPNNLIVKAKELSSKLLAYKEEYFLHGDLHMDNIISDVTDWVAIDPKGIIGPKEFEIACFDFIAKDELANNNIPELFYNRSNKLAELLNISQEVLANWVLVRLVLGACWMIEDNGCSDGFLNLINAIFPNN